MIYLQGAAQIVGLALILVTIWLLADWRWALGALGVVLLAVGLAMEADTRAR